MPRPAPLDFAAVADGVVRNNMGLGGIELVALAEVAGGRVILQPTGQSFPLRGAPPAEPGPARRRLRVHDPDAPERTALEILP